MFKHHDSFKTNYVGHDRKFTDLLIRYKDKTGHIDSLTGAGGESEFIQDNILKGSWHPQTKSRLLQLSQAYQLTSEALYWKSSIKNIQDVTINLQDVAIPIAYNNQGGENSR
ncbi:MULTISPECIES: hypothetical protein [Mucilaginibacter]|uniref:Uncharacterized protein n=1 Tax=Mucilaginibacter paludis DSM 18603 TaxID=714943 RepID=H1YIM7_9SPHI|nr:MULTISPECIES: hypothetical protein [Mucilaginibacter]EHQ26593.1 hypothetical protein Mucpa_2472 [Mucilaginibacter paludis DSM 18603]